MSQKYTKVLQGGRNIHLVVSVVRHGETDMNTATPRILQGQIDTPLNENGKKQASKLGYRLKKDRFDHIYCSDLSRSKQTAAEITRYHPDTPYSYDARLREQNLGDLAGMTWPDAKSKLKNLGLSYDDYLDTYAESNKEFEKRIVHFYTDIVEKHLLVPDRVPLSRSEENFLIQFSDALTSPTSSNGSPDTPFSETANFSNQHPVSLPKRPAKTYHILIVTHGGVIQRLMKHIVEELKFKDEDGHRLGFPKNTSLYKFVICKMFKPDGDYEWEGHVQLIGCVTHLAGISKYELVPPEELKKLEAATKNATSNSLLNSSSSVTNMQVAKDQSVSNSLSTSRSSSRQTSATSFVPPSIQRIKSKSSFYVSNSGFEGTEENGKVGMLGIRIGRHRSSSQEPSLSKKSAGVKLFGVALIQQADVAANNVRIKSLGW